MVRSFCAVILIGIVVALVTGCTATPNDVIPKITVELYAVELEFKLIKTEPVQPAEEPMPSEAPIEDTDADNIAPMEDDEITPEESTPEEEMIEPELEPAPEEEIVPAPMPEPAMPEIVEPPVNETVVYTVQQMLKVGNNISIMRVEIIKYIEEISEVEVEMEGNRIFSIEGKTKQIPTTSDFNLSIMMTFKDEKLKLNFSCEASVLLSAINDSEQIIATVDDLKLVLICKKIQKIKYEK